MVNYDWKQERKKGICTVLLHSPWERPRPTENRSQQFWTKRGMSSLGFKPGLHGQNAITPTLVPPWPIWTGVLWIYWSYLHHLRHRHSSLPLTSCKGFIEFFAATLLKMVDWKKFLIDSCVGKDYNQKSLKFFKLSRIIKEVTSSIMIQQRSSRVFFRIFRSWD